MVDAPHQVIETAKSITGNVASALLGFLQKKAELLNSRSKKDEPAINLLAEQLQRVKNIQQSISQVPDQTTRPDDPRSRMPNAQQVTILLTATESLSTMIDEQAETGTQIKRKLGDRPDIIKRLRNLTGDLQTLIKLRNGAPMGRLAPEIQERLANDNIFALSNLKNLSAVKAVLQDYVLKPPTQELTPVEGVDSEKVLAAIANAGKLLDGIMKPDLPPPQLMQYLEARGRIDHLGVELNRKVHDEYRSNNVDAMAEAVNGVVAVLGSNAESVPGLVEAAKSLKTNFKTNEQIRSLPLPKPEPRRDSLRARRGLSGPD